MRRRACALLVLGALLAGCGNLGAGEETDRVNKLQLVRKADVASHPEGSPARTFLEWWRALQYGSATQAVRLYSRDVEVEPKRLQRQLETGVDLLSLRSRPRVDDVIEEGDEATVFVVFTSAVGNPNGRADKVQSPRAFDLVREGGELENRRQPLHRANLPPRHQVRPERFGGAEAPLGPGRVTSPGSDRDHHAAAARVGAGTAVTSIAWISARALALATLVLLTQTLPAGDLGALLAAIAAGLLGATLATGGLPDATVRSAASAFGSQDRGFGRGDLWDALLRFAATLPFVFVLLLAISDGADGLNWGLWAAGALLAVTQGGATILAAVFRARGQAGRFALATGLAVAVGRTLVAALALALDASAGFVLWSFVVINALVIAATWTVATRGLPRGRSDKHGAGPLQLGGAVWALLAHLDIVVVGVVLGADAAGVYGATLRLAEFSYQFVIAVSVIYLPEAVKLFAAGRRDALVALYRTSSRWSALLSLLLAGVGFVLAPRFAELLLPDDASVSATVMRILFIGYAFYGALGLGYLTSVAAGSFREIRNASLVALPAIVGGTVMGAELWGLTGAACATAAGYVAFNLWWLRITHTALGVTPFDRAYLRALLACMVSVAGSAALAAALFGAPPLVAIAAVGLGATALWLLVAVIAQALTPEERGAIRQSFTVGRARRPGVRRRVAEE